MKVLIVEDQAMLRESVTRVIDAQSDMEVIASLSDAAKALDQIDQNKPDLVLMDICTENGSSGLAATRAIKDKHPDLKVVAITGMPEMTFVEQAKEAEVDSFVYKNVGMDELLSIIRSTMEGYSTYPQQRTSGQFVDSSRFSDVEMKILRLVCEAKSRKEIAAELFMSEGTIKRHISEILAKTGYDSILRLAVRLVSEGYIVPSVDDGNQS